MTLPELISFIENSVMKNPLFSGYIDDDTRRQITQAGDMIRETITSYDDGSSDPEVEIHEYTYDEFGGLLDQN